MQWNLWTKLTGRFQCLSLAPKTRPYRWKCKLRRSSTCKRKDEAKDEEDFCYRSHKEVGVQTAPKRTERFQDNDSSSTSGTSIRAERRTIFGNDARETGGCSKPGVKKNGLDTR